MKQDNSMEATIHKIVPAVLVACIFALAQAYILTGQNKDTIDRLSETNKKQWEYIADMHTNIIQLQEQQKQCLSKEQYYKGKECNGGD